MQAVIDIVAGAVLLLVGRRLYWLFVAIAGFYVGFEVARAVFVGPPEWVIWVAAAAAGVIGALVAMLFQRVAFALGGFYAGAYLTLVAAERFLPSAAGPAIIIIGGVIGAIAAALVMDWAIIVLSSMVGAALIVSYLNLGQVGNLLAYAGLLAVGIVVQAQLTRPDADARPSR